MFFKLNKSKEFILLRFKKELGGFGATPLLPPTLEDTYFGVKALYFLDKDELNNYSSQIYQFLSNYLKKSPLDLISLYRVLAILRLIGKGDLPKDLNLSGLSLEKFIVEKSALRLYSLWSIATHLRERKILKNIKEFIKNYPIKTLEDLYYIGKIDKKLWITKKDMVIKSQNGDGGFGFYPGTTSFLENTYFALKILNSAAQKEEGLIQHGLEFVKACQNSDGGFSRKPGGISYLETTSLSIELIYTLKGYIEKISG